MTHLLTKLLFLFILLAAEHLYAQAPAAKPANAPPPPAPVAEALSCSDHVAYLQAVIAGLQATNAQLQATNQVLQAAQTQARLSELQQANQAAVRNFNNLQQKLATANNKDGCGILLDGTFNCQPAGTPAGAAQPTGSTQPTRTGDVQAKAPPDGGE